MHRASPRQGWPSLSSKQAQRGQALVYGLFVLTGGLAALFFLFNTGQLAREKTKLVNTADAVAYSAGVMHARTLNFQSYTNRAMVANTIAIAQLTSLASWLKYTNAISQYGYALENPKFVMYESSYIAAQYIGQYGYAALIDKPVLEDLAKSSDAIIKGLKLAQQVAYVGLLPARQQVMEEVAELNYRDDGVVKIDALPLTGAEFTEFLSRRSGDERDRFAQVVDNALKKDEFIRKRSWDMPALWADCATAYPRVDWLSRRGGTERIGYDEWKALDTMSEKRWVPKNKTDVLCKGLAEDPVGWGAQTAADNPSFDPDPTHYDSAPIINPSPTALALITSSSSEWGYSGMPEYYELSKAALKEAEPRLQFAIRLRREQAETLTSDGRSAIRPSPRLNGYASDAAKGEYAAIGASEVYFERPVGQRDNLYGKQQGKPSEIGSLFNPYWQVRLMSPSAESIKAAQALQGVVMAP